MNLNIQVSPEDADFLLKPFIVQPRPAGEGGKQQYEIRIQRKRRRWDGLHRLIMRRVLGQKIPIGIIVDHINRDPLDNRRENLRLATARQNAANRTRRVRLTSKYNGVYSRKTVDGIRWQARGSKPNGRGGYTKLTIGTYDTENEAARAWNEWAVKEYGEFANINIIQD